MMGETKKIFSVNNIAIIYPNKEIIGTLEEQGFCFTLSINVSA